MEFICSFRVSVVLLGYSDLFPCSKNKVSGATSLCAISKPLSCHSKVGPSWMTIWFAANKSSNICYKICGKSYFRILCIHVWNIFDTFYFISVITGQHRNGVISARTRIELLAETFRKKQPFTHFLSFALNQPEVQDRFLQFKEEILLKCSKVGEQIILTIVSELKGIFKHTFKKYKRATVV